MLQTYGARTLRYFKIYLLLITVVHIQQTKDNRNCVLMSVVSFRYQFEDFTIEIELRGKGLNSVMIYCDNI